MKRAEIDKLLNEAQERYEVAIKRSQWHVAAAVSRHINELLLLKAVAK